MLVGQEREGKMSTHTLGPWTIRPSTSLHRTYVLTGSHIPDEIPWEEDCANAHLIAAAPDLLATLEAINEWGGRHLKYDIQWAASFGPLTRAAIAKAQGKED
jgi:hypothetical protein